MMKYNFNAEAETSNCIKWIKDYFDKNGKDCNAIIGLSGGKDSSIAFALCVEALGRDRVIGIYMPNGVTNADDIFHIELLVKHFETMYHTLNIKHVVNESYSLLQSMNISLGNQVITNHPARIRMSMLYAIAAMYNGRVVNTCNLSEDYVGYSTKYGDAAGDFAPLGGLVVQEIKQIGYEMKLPIELIDRVPEDGMCGKSDEENLGFSYLLLDNYIRTGTYNMFTDKEKIEKIDYLNKYTRHKYETIPYFYPDID